MMNITIKAGIECIARNINNAIRNKNKSNDIKAITPNIREIAKNLFLLYHLRFFIVLSIYSQNENTRYLIKMQ